MIGARAEPLYKKEAKERRGAGGDQRKKAVPKNSTEALQGQARDKAAAVGVSAYSIDRAKEVQEHGSEELIAATAVCAKRQHAA